MLHTLSDILRFKALSGDTKLPVTELFFDPYTHAVRYVALDVGGWFDKSEVVVAARHFGDPDSEERTWPVDVDYEAIESAPRWHDEHEDHGFFSIENWPPLIVGPFGSTFSPLLLNAQAQDDARHQAGYEDDDSLPPPAMQAEAMAARALSGEKTAKRQVRGLKRATRWRGLDVYGEDGEMGELVDLIFSPHERKLTHLVIGDAPGVPGRHAVPVEKIRHLAAGDTHLVLNVSREDLKNAPQPDQMDQLDHGWRDRLSSYFGLS